MAAPVRTRQTLLTCRVPPSASWPTTPPPGPRAPGEGLGGYPVTCYAPSREGGNQSVGPIQATWEKVKLAAVKLLVLAGFMVSHWGLAWLVHRVLPPKWKVAEELLYALFMVAFSLVYVENLWEMVGIFVPRLDRWRQRVVRGSVEKEES